MGLRLAVLGLLAGCSFRLPDAAPGDGGGDADGPPDTPPGGCVTFSKQLDTCALPPGGLVRLDGQFVFNTDTGVLTRVGQPDPIPVISQPVTTRAGEAMAILATRFELVQNTVVRAAGARPLAILASDEIRLDSMARIDVAIGGAGARVSCDNTPVNGGNRDGGAGGGGGGGFGGAGGKGGNGNAGSTVGLGGNGGAVIELPGGPLGGCPGAKGGDDNNDVGGAGGAGGGAIYAVAGARITVQAGAGLAAGGGGGGGGEQSGASFGDAGGGGGGSGGLIWLEAPRIEHDGVLAANGGGGGEGSGDRDPGDAGDPGQLGAARASGGSGSSPSGTEGGLGGAREVVSGDAVIAVDAGGGGGGGGGAGLIVVDSPSADLRGEVSPPVSSAPAQPDDDDDDDEGDD